MEPTIEIDETKVGKESARLLSVVVGETHLSRIELAAILARSFQQPGFLPRPVLEAFLLVAQCTARLPSIMVAGSETRPPSEEQGALLELLQDGAWLDALGERAAAFEPPPNDVYAENGDVETTSARLMARFGPLYEKLAK